MAKKAVQEAATVAVSRTRLFSGKVKDHSEDNKKIQIRPFVTDTANVSVKFGVTIPSAKEQYGSYRVDVMISVPCYVEEMLDVFNDTRDLVDRLVGSEIDRMRGEE